MCYCETPDKESSSVDKCYKIDGGILETEQKRYASFRRVRGLGHTTVSELLMAIQEKVLFDTNTYRCIDTHYRTIIWCIAEIKSYLCSTMEQQSIGNGIALINFQRAYANSVVSNGSYH
ncbi:unnamed protein product [Pocillopora meandrina]|uniref:Uncharacterized protein n=1 Tax=Pocillopora meandrina TaxID=46732 RepID=A0AAU9XIG3_9CNID|nr:unnamed protein product [Pocillopora meandrina]